MAKTRVLSLYILVMAPTAASSVSAVPFNDDFSDAFLLDERPADSVKLSNQGATREPGEPLIDGNPGGRSVWCRWVAPRTERTTFHTFGSDFDTLLGVYTGATVDSLQLVAENDDAVDGLHSLVELVAVAGRAYHIVVDGVSSEDEEDGAGPQSGTFVLSWLSGAPLNDDFADGLLLQESSGRNAGANFGATPEAGEPRIAGVAGGRSVWWQWTAPRTERMTFHTVGSSFDTRLGVYTGTEVTALQLVAENDDIFLGPGVCRQPPCRRPPPPRERPESRVDFDAVAGTLYHIAVDGFEGEAGSILLTWLPTPGAAPANDRFAGRVRFEHDVGLALGSNAGATTEPGEPDHAAAGGTSSVWWSWIASEAGVLVLSTRGSTFDTVLAIYTGAAVDDLELVVENDDHELIDDETSIVRLRVAEGTEYQVAVAGYEDDSGIVSLEWSLAPGAGAIHFVRGDCDGNGDINISDAVCSLSWLFQGGAEPECAAAANADGAEAVNVADAIYLLSHLFRGGSAPPAPFPECGPGGADEVVGCGVPPERCR
jgi:hypothetical protein